MKDFYKYYGYGDISFLYAYGKQTFELLLRDNLRLNSSNKGQFLTTLFLFQILYLQK